MHRTIDASIPSEKTDATVKELMIHPQVVGLNVLHKEGDGRFSCLESKRTNQRHL
jgi:hypothetical protein